LVDAFASTLEETLEADLLLLVVDASDPERSEHLQTTEDVLEELGAQEKPRLVVVNKADRPYRRGALMADISKIEPSVPVVFTSAQTGEGLQQLVSAVQELIDSLMTSQTFRLPLSRYDLVARIYEHGRVEEERHDGDSVTLKARVPAALRNRLSEYWENGR
jgi:GTP-binding protein HflX